MSIEENINNFVKYKKELQDKLDQQFLDLIEKNLGFHDVTYNLVLNNVEIVNKEGSTFMIYERNKIISYLGYDYIYKYITKLVSLFCSCDIGDITLHLDNVNNSTKNMPARTQIKIGPSWFWIGSSQQYIKDVDNIKDIADFVNKFYSSRFTSVFNDNRNGTIQIITLNQIPIPGNIFVDYDFGKIYNTCKKFTMEDIRKLLEIKHNVKLLKRSHYNLYENDFTVIVDKMPVIKQTISNIGETLKHVDDVQNLLNIKQQMEQIIDQRVEDINKEIHKKNLGPIIQDMDKHLQEFKNKQKYTDAILLDICRRYKSVLNAGPILCAEDFNKLFATDFDIENNNQYKKDLQVLNYILYKMNEDLKNALFCIAF